jgi:precorrin-4/cobalt-precorrin-4 C11-methyltransferase
VENSLNARLNHRLCNAVALQQEIGANINIQNHWRPMKLSPPCISPHHHDSTLTAATGFNRVLWLLIYSLAIVLLLPKTGLSQQDENTRPADIVVAKKTVLTVRIKDEKPLDFTAEDLQKLERKKIAAVVDDKTLAFEGVPLSAILQKAGMTWGIKCSLWLDCYMIVDSEDGYRAVFSIPEIDPGLCHKRVILADRCGGAPIRKADGPYEIVEEDAKQRGRWVKQVISFSVKEAAEDDDESGADSAATSEIPPGKIYLVGMGPGDAELVTIKAARILKEADCVFCFDYLKEEAARYVTKDKITVAPSSMMGGFHGQKLEDIPPNMRDRAKKNMEEIEKFNPKIRELAAAGKTIVFADSGDPTIYCPWSWITAEFADLNPIVIPGLSSFNSASAALKQSITSQNGSILISPGSDLGTKTDKGRISGMLILFTHRAKFDELLPRLQARYPADTPIAVVCEASYETEKVYRGTLSTIQGIIGGDKLPHLYLIYVGDSLKLDSDGSQSPSNDKNTSTSNDRNTDTAKAQGQ